MEAHHNRKIFAYAVAAAGVVVGAVAGAALASWHAAKHGENALAPPHEHWRDLIGRTPMFKVQTLSKETGCTILAKAEFLNPGGTSKDRIAKGIVEEALADGRLAPGDAIVEGTSGSTGIALSMLASSHGLGCRVYLPDDQAAEKTATLTALGADVRRVPNVSITNKNHYVNLARQDGQRPGSVFSDQFETLANFRAHSRTTGPEVWQQTGGKLDAFVMAAGTGGTIAGVSCFIKEQARIERLAAARSWLGRALKAVLGPLVGSATTPPQRVARGDWIPGTAMKPYVILADPQGSSLFHAAQHGTAYTAEQEERSLRRHRYDTVVEGVGLDRVTTNFRQAQIDAALQFSDQQVVDMSRRLLAEEGLFLGSSSALNMCAARETALRLGPGHTVVTVACDAGHRHVSRFWNPAFLASRGLHDPRSAAAGAAASGGGHCGSDAEGGAGGESNDQF